MPWPFFIPEFLKKRACRYLLHHYLGQYLEERISLDDLSLDLYHGTGTVTNLPLNVDIINESLEEVSAPVRVLSGYVGRITVTVPWTSLMSSSCTVRISGLNITVTPHLSNHSGGQSTMTDSLFFSMGTSRQLAEEVLKGKREDGEEEVVEEAGGGFEGMEALTRAIETVLLRVQISLTDTIINVSYSPLHNQNRESFLSLKVDKIEFFDEVTRQDGGGGVDDNGDIGESALAEFTTKLLQLSGLSMEVGVVDASTTSHLIGSLSDFPDFHVSEEDGKAGDVGLCSVPIACASGDVTVKVKIRMCDSAPGPKLNVEVFVGVVHLLLSPQQLNTVVEIVTGLMARTEGQERSGGGGSSVLGRHHGHNRPIPQQAMKNIETQLQQHIDREQRRKREREETLKQDPWQLPVDQKMGEREEVGSCMTESMYSNTDEEFCSFNTVQTGRHLQSATSMARPISRGSSHVFGRYNQTPGSQELSDIELTEGVGLQQFSLTNLQQASPPSPMSQLRNKQYRGVVGNENELDVCRYLITVGGVTCVLLEANPVHTHASNSASQTESQPTSLGSSPEYCSLDESGLDPVKYFSAISEVLKDGVNRQSLLSKKDELGRILPADHILLWMCSVRVVAISQSSVCDTELTTGSLELWEYLYRNEPNLTNITSPVSVQPLLQLSEEIKGSQPCMRVSCRWEENGQEKMKTASSPAVVTEVMINHAQLYLDITLLDRLHPLLNPPPSQRDTLPSSFTHMFNIPQTDTAQQLLFQQALSSETYSSSRQRVNMKLTCSSVNCSLKFPVPDLSGEFHPPWYRTPLRTETMFIEIDELVLSSSSLLPATFLQSAHLSLQFEQAKFYLSMDGSLESKQLFLTVGQRHTPSPPSVTSKIKTKGLDVSSIKVTIQSFSDSSLDQSHDVTVSNTCGSPTDDFMMNIHHGNPSPFSHKRTLYSSSAKGFHSEELVLPGTTEEMTQFESHASSTAQYCITAMFPCVNMHIPSKAFLETLYNRFTNDLLLWEPASPAAVEKASARSMFYSCMDLLQPAVTHHEKFKLCKSVLEDAKEEEDDEVEEKEDEKEDQPDPHNKEHVATGPSRIAVSLSVGKGLLSLHLPVKTEGLATSLPDGTTGVFRTRDINEEEEENQNEEEDERLLDLSPRPTPIRIEPCYDQQNNGLIAMETGNLHLFVVAGYHGETGRTILCARAHEVCVGYCGALKQAGLTGLTSLSEGKGHLLMSQLQPLLYPSVGRLSESSGDYWLPSDQEPMLALALDSRTESENKRKVNKCAVMVRETMVHHYTPTTQDNWVQQVADLFTLKDEAVKGYTSWTVITELHTHIQDCAVEYTPVHLSAHIVVALTSMSFTSSLVTGSPLLVLRLVLDRTRLFLSNKRHRHANLSEGFICVMEIGLFELVLRLCNKSQESTTLSQFFSKVPDVELQCSGTDVHFWLCVDSCSLLRNLILYMAENRDLVGAPQASNSCDTVTPVSAKPFESSAGEYDHVQNSTHNEHVQQSPPPPPPPPPSHVSPPLPYESDYLGDLISEAMEDESPSLPPYSPSKTGVSTSRPIREVEDEGVTSTMQGSLEEALTRVIFESDDEEDEEKRASVKRGQERTPFSSHSRKKGAIPMADEVDDDDFCVLVAPTTAKVGPGAVPVVKCLLEEEEELSVVLDHFAIPNGATDQLRRPKHFPDPVTVYTLKELTITWHLYGGMDFSSPSPSSSSSFSSSTADKFTHHRHGGPAPGYGKMAAGGDGVKMSTKNSRGKGREKKGTDKEERQQGGPGRDLDVLIEIELSKLRVQHEVYPSDTPECSRLVVLLHDMEVRDRLVQSRINKFLYQYSTDTMPRQTHANMLSLKLLLSRPEPEVSVSTQPLEASIRISLLPLRLNVDQDTVFFLYNFFQRLMPNEPAVSTSREAGGVSPTGASIKRSTTPRSPSLTSGTNPARNHSSSPLSSSSSVSTEVFIKSFVFSPEVPIRIDYEAKWFHSEQVGTMTGILLGLSHLDNSEVTLKPINYKQGVLGWGCLVELVANEWAQDIKKYQLPRILKGVGPMYHVTQLVQGVVDLFWLPVQQYQEDGRVLWGIQRGASSFATSSGVAVVELTNRLLQSVQNVAETAYDMAGCSGIGGGGGREGGLQAVAVSGTQPADVREGLANAYNVVTTGIGDTAWDLYQTAAHEHDERGVSGAVGGVLRHIPGTLVRPVIFASEATRHILGGVKNQFLPDARQEASDKWKNEKA